jgi:hypothetical protein
MPGEFGDICNQPDDALVKAKDERLGISFSSSAGVFY